MGAFHGPLEGLFLDESSATYWIAKPNVVLEAKLDQMFSRISQDQLRWEVKTKSVVEKFSSVTKAVFSGWADEETITKRKRSCFGDGEQPQCPQLLVSSKGRWCGKCECGSTRLAQLDGSLVPKLRWRILDCPLGRPGFSNELRS